MSHDTNQGPRICHNPKEALATQAELGYTSASVRLHCECIAQLINNKAYLDFSFLERGDHPPHLRTQVRRPFIGT